MAFAAPALADRNTESASSYDRGFQRFEKGDIRGARIEIMKALQSDPNNELARLVNARIMLEGANGVGAQTEIEKAIKAGIPRDKTRHLMAHAYLLQRDFDKALKEADPAVVPDQFSSYAARIRGRIQTSLDQPERARAEFELATRIAPQSADALVDLSRYQMMMGQGAEGEKNNDRALALEPSNLPALLLKGDYVRRRLGLERSMPYYNQALQIDPNNIEALLERASTLSDLKRTPEAKADLKKVQGIVADHPLALYLEAVIESRAGQYDKANALMTRTKGSLDRYPPALLLQGMLAYQLNNVQQAEEYLGKVVAQVPESDVARKVFAAVQLRKGDANGAIDTLGPIVSSGRADPRTLALLGSAYARKGDYNNAQAFLERASKAAPNDAAMRTQLAMTRVAQGNTSAAAADLSNVLKEDPNSQQALMLSALVNMRANKFREALDITNRLVKAHPNSPIGYNMRGAALMGLNNKKGAEANFRAAVAKQPKFVEGRRNLAQLLISDGRTEAGRQELLRVLEANRNDIRAMTSLAQLSARAGKTEDQIAWLKRAATAQPRALEPRVALMQTYVSVGQPNRALTEARALERDFNNNPRAFEATGIAFMVGRKPAEAESSFNRLINLVPNAVPPRVMLARAQVAQNRPDAARGTLNQALTMQGQNLLPVYIDLIGLETRDRRINEAVALVDRMRKAYPRSNIPDQVLGDAYLTLGDAPKAMAAYQAARKINFDRAVATRMATASLRARKPADAIALMQAYTKANPRDAQGSAQLADLYLQTKQHRQAIAIYQDLRKKGLGNDPIVNNNLAWSLHQMRDPKAASFAEVALKAAPRSPAVQDTLGTILIETKANPKRGLALLQLAAKTSPRDANIRHHLGVAFAANGKKAEAKRELTTALRLPNLENAAAARRLLATLG
ncbi:XrtA/PEP-CTERM system TPR-repeat protein PrsT [Sphingoaurantiacus capsulatus]|uniref:XrtA/PEP-CTERM system TPR-repeat protein PrsT n=2 Tax=Sphingoaurantiacus capsulatus TaxID=1771310 RepID=A0ABV7XBF3_9SPHN